MVNTEQLWPGWETVGFLGKGSYGTVYEVHRLCLGIAERAAIKVITIPQNAQEIEELKAEGFNHEAIAKIYEQNFKQILSEYTLMRKMSDCANVVACDDVRYQQHPDGIGWDIYIKMELLTPILKLPPQALTQQNAQKLGKDMCQALAVCKENGIVHRDIKPQNIFVSADGTFKLGDFGVARVMEKTGGATKIGTCKYMAPEIFNNQPYGSSADIYSLGLLLYWLLNERRVPFLPMPPAVPSFAEEEQSKYRRFSGESFPPPKHGSEALKAVVMKACAFYPADRFVSAEAFGRALEDAKRNVISFRPVAANAAQDATQRVRASAQYADGTIYQKPAPQPQYAYENPQDRPNQIANKYEQAHKHRSMRGVTVAVIVLIVAILCVLMLPFAIRYWKDDDGDSEDSKEKEAATLEQEPTGEDTPEAEEPSVNGQDTQTQPATQNTTQSQPTTEQTTPPASAVHIGEVVVFGTYEQDGYSANGRESITWKVLDVRDGKALLLSTFALDSKPYHNSASYVNWANCSLRIWLNEDFFYSAFSQNEQRLIATTTVVMDENVGQYAYDSGGNTQDKVFLLSRTEVAGYLGGTDQRTCSPTIYAVNRGAWENDRYKCWWWTRSMGYDQTDAYCVYSHGGIDLNGTGVWDTGGGVRPAMWVDVAAFS